MMGVSEIFLVFLVGGLPDIVMGNFAGVFLKVFSTGLLFAGF